jgi:hypothetical protein
MGHVIFIILHFIALLFFAWALLLTIPLHLIYGASSNADSKQRSTARKCPFCAEPIMDAAIKCKHCDSDLPVKQKTGA